MDERAAAFAEWLRTEIDRRGWSLSDFARRAEVGTGLAGNWLTGKRRPKPDSCARIAAALELNPDVVLAAAGHRPLHDGPKRYQLERRIHELESVMRAQVKLIEEEIEAEGGVAVPYYGKVPAEHGCRPGRQQNGETVPVLSEYIGDGSPSDHLVVEANGDSLRAHREAISRGDRVLLERCTTGRLPENGEVVLVRVEGRDYLASWDRDGDFIQLRDGQGGTLRRLSVMDEFDLVGVFVARWSAPRRG